jgi:hypothetical protein
MEGNRMNEQLAKLQERIASLSKRIDAADNRIAKADTYTPPEGVRSAAARGLELRAKWKRGGLSNSEASSQGIGSGVQRATNLKNGDALSFQTVMRMHSFFSRHAKNYRPEEKEPDGGPTAGTIAWYLWGGNAGKSWADGIVNSVRKEGEGAAPTASGPTADAVHVPGPVQVDDKPKAKPKKKPEPVVKLSEPIATALKQKVEDNNKAAKDDSRKTSFETLRTVFERGLAAHKADEGTNATSGAYALARVNAYLKLLRSGRPDNKAYVQDNGLLPAGHPKATKEK